MTVMPQSLQLMMWSVLLLLLPVACGFSWGLDRNADRERGAADQAVHPRYTSTAVPIPVLDRYATTMNELQELESKPLCHRIAARLLVNNCQLVNGQDDAQARPDSDGLARDFVDAYAISLAICDLERGSFVIPPSCSHFQESTLAGIPIPHKPTLHVSTDEITECLKDFGHTDSAWNTWVNYRHQAMRFCEVSLAENKKDLDVRFYQRLTRILANLTEQVEKDIEERLQSLDRKLQDASASVEHLNPEIDRLHMKLTEVERFMKDQLERTAKDSNEILRSGLDQATNLRQLLATLLKAALDNAAEVASAHESSLQVATQQANREIANILAALATAALSSTSLEGQLATSLSYAADLSQRQQQLEVGLDRLNDIADVLSLKYENHEERLERAQEKAKKLLETLDNATSYASILQHPILSGLGLLQWWPYVLCPVASLVVGSYGLEPSAFRNLWLVGIGELAGFIISSANRYAGMLLTTSESFHHDSNETFNAPSSFSNIFDNSDFGRNLHLH